MDRQTDPKIIAIVSYLTAIGWIAGVLLNNPRSNFASFHLRQSLGTLLMFVVASMIGWFPVLGWVSGFALMMAAVVFWFIGLVAAIQGKEQTVPILGEYFQEWFARTLK